MSDLQLGSALSHLFVLDEARRNSGVWLDRLGLGPVRTPSHILHTWPGAQLLAFGGAAGGRALLIVPAPIKRAYIWDLAPEVSVVRRCLAAGLRVYMLEWIEPKGAARSFGLEDVITKVIAGALEAIERDSGEHRIVLTGHSLGGTLAALAAAHYPDRVCGLVLIEAPLAFGENGGVLVPLVKATAPSAVASLADDCVPGALLSLSAMAAAPAVFVAEPYFDWLESATFGAVPTLRLRVERWIRDELAMPGRLFLDIVEGLYREDRFASGRLSLAGVKVDPAALAKVPTLAVVDQRSRVVPPASVTGPFDGLPKKSLAVLAYGGDRGVALQHVGALVGDNAHRLLWPKILRWIAELQR
jgi:polyhydroxyalkanoate synthase subunit PhaC